MTGVATQVGLQDALTTTTGALRIIEELRRAVIGDESVCQPSQDSG